MKYHVERLDGRHTGHDIMQYRLRMQITTGIPNSHHKNFHTLRSWMREQYGDSCERDLYKKTALAFHGYESFNPPWCWHVDRDYPNNMYVYVQNREVLSHISLKWI